MHIVLTVLHTYPKAMARTICLTIENLLSLWFFPFILMTLMFDMGVILLGEIILTEGEGSEEAPWYNYYDQ